MDDSEDSNQPVLPSVNGFYNLLKTGSMILVKEEPSELPNDMIEDVIAEQEQFNGASLRLQNDAPMPLQSDAPTEPQNDAPMLLQSDAPTEAQNDAPMLLLSDASLMLRSPRRIQNNDSTPLQNDAHIPLQSHVAMHLPSDASMQLDNVGSTQQRGDAHLQQSDATIQLLNDAPLKLQSNGFTQLRSDAHLQLQSDAHLQLQSDASIQIQNDASTQPQISLCKTEPDCDYMEPILIDEIKTEGDYLNEDEMPVENTLHDTSNAAVREPACDESDAIFIKTEFPEACTKTEPTEVKSTGVHNFYQIGKTEDNVKIESWNTLVRYFDVPKPTCELCGQTFNLYKRLKHHQLTSHNSHKCRICKEKFTFASLAHHMKYTHPDASRVLYTCALCDRNFIRKCALSSHIQKHLSATPHICDVCDACFARTNELQTHKTMHEKSHAYKCQTCAKTFRRRETLSSHLQTHFTEMRLCKICDFVLEDAASYREHKRMHRVVCAFCEKTFIGEEHLRTHCHKFHEKKNPC